MKSHSVEVRRSSVEGYNDCVFGNLQSHELRARTVSAKPRETRPEPDFMHTNMRQFACGNDLINERCTVRGATLPLWKHAKGSHAKKWMYSTE